MIMADATHGLDRAGELLEALTCELRRIRVAQRESGPGADPDPGLREPLDALRDRWGEAMREFESVCAGGAQADITEGERRWQALRSALRLYRRLVRNDAANAA
jgi:hypothetical protein